MDMIDDARVVNARALRNDIQRVFDVTALEIGEHVHADADSLSHHFAVFRFLVDGI